MLQEELNVDTTDNPNENSPEISVIALEREFYLPLLFVHKPVERHHEETE